MEPVLTDPDILEPGQIAFDGNGRMFVIELRGVGETGEPLLGLLVTMTRQIRRHGGEVVLAGVSREMGRFLDEMRLEDFWDVFRGVEEAKGHLIGRDDAGRA